MPFRIGRTHCKQGGTGARDRLQVGLADGFLDGNADGGEIRCSRPAGLDTMSCVKARPGVKYE